MNEMEIHWYTPEDIERIANEPCEECGRAASECNCPDSDEMQ